MASAGGGNDRRPYLRFRIPVVGLRAPQPSRQGQQITITFQQRAPGQGGQQPQIRVIPVQQQAPSEAELREQEETTRRVAEDNHRKAELRRALTITQPPLADYNREEGVVRVSWQPVVTRCDEVEYTLNGWKDGAGDPTTLYRGQLTSCSVTTETLCRGHTHQVAVYASAAGETGEHSPRSKVEVPALPPDQPLPPKIFSRTKNSLGLRWNPPSSNGSTISEYCLEWDEGTGQFVELFSGKGKQFKFNHKFQPGSHTHFRVRARNAIGWSEYSEETTHSVGQAAPASPSPPSLSSRTSHSLTLHWSPPPGSVSISSFCLEMDDPNSGYGFCPVYQGDGLSYVCRSLQRVTVYSFRLAATNEAGTSPSSPPISYTTLPEPPGCPGNVLLCDQPHSTFLNLEWSPPSNDGGSPIESYILQVDDGVGGALTDVYKGSEVNFQLDSLTPGRSYRCRVCAVSSGGQGVWSNEALFQTPPTLPCPPNDLHVVGKVTQSSTVLSWSRPSSDGGSAVTCYEVHCRRQEGEWVASGIVADPLSFSPSSTPSLTHTLTHLTPGTHYSVRVGCRNIVGLSEWSDCLSFTTAPGPPSAPCSPSVTMVTAHSAQLQWMASVEFGSTVVGYEVEWGTVGGVRHTKHLPPSPCMASLIHLTPDTEHTARVKAISDVGHSDWCPFVTFTTSPSTPSPPSHLALVSSTPNDLLVAWSVPPSPGSPITHYHIHMVPPPSPDSAHIVLPTETQTTLAGLQPNTQYMIRVQAENSIGLGPLSSPLTACTLPPPPLPPPLSLVSALATSLKVSWGRKTTKSLTYTLQLATDTGRFHTVYTGSAVAHKLQRLKPATQYSLRIAASSDSGQGAWSDHLTCETLPPEPSAPLDLSMHQEDSLIMLSWSEVKHTGPVTYEVQLKIGGQDFTQVYRGSSTSYSHSIVSYTHHEARVRACTSCLANNRKEQLFSAFTPLVSYDCVEPPATLQLTAQHSSEIDTDSRVSEEEGRSHHWWLVILFVGVSLLVVVIAIILGQLLVA